MNSSEILENIQKLLFYISEILSDESKLYLSKESAIKEIRKYCDKYDFTYTELQQIKTELEAWEICKKHYHINKYEDINKGRDKKRFDITIWLNTENCDFKSCASYEECLKVKNALEVKQ